ncbi:MAG: hypothetical protein Q7R68_10820 [Nitrospirales bacterium]|nr:hypothetical protein [Nitrospirales bacterium]
MTRKHFIALADKVRVYQLTKYRNGELENKPPFLIDVLADFCQEQSEAFNREAFIGYIRGDCGPSGGKIKG